MSCEIVSKCQTETPKTAYLAFAPVNELSIQQFLVPRLDLAIYAAVARGYRLRLVRGETFLGQALRDLTVLEATTLQVEDEFVFGVKLGRDRFACGVASSSDARYFLRGGSSIGAAGARRDVSLILDSGSAASSWCRAVQSVRRRGGHGAERCAEHLPGPHRGRLRYRRRPHCRRL